MNLPQPAAAPDDRPPLRPQQKGELKTAILLIVEKFADGPREDRSFNEAREAIYAIGVRERKKPREEPAHPADFIWPTTSRQKLL